ncbi:MAG: DNA polymerase III subunit gamma/tau [Firmicutes bacterium]|nr:DNA polymerase III subunit gamma/tau [Bacillota bacterium]
MYTALYRARRPEVFSEILGQQHIVKILKHQIETDTVSHAYLFCGTRGTGKTTTARILAKAVNCLSDGERPCGHCANCMAIKDGTFMDVIEIDAASNNGVENIRELRESVKYPPAIGRKKVYIIDEVHMLSTGAFNALLKTLEEPPENVMFILATTEPQKLPATILSRCMRLDFKRVPQNILMEGMREICTDKGVEITESALKLLSNCADGSVRDGLSILDQVLASGEKTVDRDKVLEYVGAAGEDFFIDLTELVSLKKVAEALVLLDGVLADGKDVKQLMKDWTAHYRNLMITKFIKSPEDMLNMSSENIRRIQEQSMHISLEEINDAIIRLSKTINDARWSTQPRILLELAIVSIASGLDENAALIRHERRPAQAAAPSVNTAADTAHCTVPDSDSVENTRREKETAPPKPVMEQSDENEALWHAVFEEGEDGAGSFNLIRNGTVLAEVSEKTFTVIATSPFAKRYAQQKQQLIEGIMSRRLGRPMKMLCYSEGENIPGGSRIGAHVGPGGTAGADTEENMEDMARKASEILGMDITIE